jgi:hypothetical protein
MAGRPLANGMNVSVSKNNHKSPEMETMTTAVAMDERRKKRGRVDSDAKTSMQSGAKAPATSTVRRLNINLPEKTFNDLERTATKTGRTMTDIVRVGVSVAQVVVEEVSHGRKLAVIDSNGRVLKELILLV